MNRIFKLIIALLGAGAYIYLINEVVIKILG